jgi:hypothetical protein
MNHTKETYNFNANVSFADFFCLVPHAFYSFSAGKLKQIAVNLQWGNISLLVSPSFKLEKRSFLVCG